jgi:hypothetical protein
VITSSGICPYSRFSPELREKWHKERGIEDPFKKMVRKEIMEEQPKKEGEDYEEGSSFFIPPPRNKKEPVIKEPESAPLVSEEGMTKQERYRAANKEKLAEKARARRAGGGVQGRETRAKPGRGSGGET